MKKKNKKLENEIYKKLKKLSLKVGVYPICVGLIAFLFVFGLLMFWINQFLAGIIISACFLLGFLVLISYLYTKYKKKALDKKNKKILFSQVSKLSPYEFEEWIASYFSNHGSKAFVTKRSGDYGIDVIVYYQNKKIGIQAKKYAQPVGIKAVQEAYAGQKFYDCDSAWIVTTASNFTNQAIELAEKTGIELFNYAKSESFFKQ